MADLIPYTTEQILDLFKAAYYEQTGETLRIGSDEFAFSTVAAYVLRVFEQSLQHGANNCNIETATGGALDAIGASYNLKRSDLGKPATCGLSATNTTNDEITIGEGDVYCEYPEVTFSNQVPVVIAAGGTAKILLTASENGEEFNGIVGMVPNPIEGITFSAASMTYGGRTSPYEDTIEDDNIFRAYIKANMTGFGFGTARYYEQLVRNVSEGVISSVYCLREGDAVKDNTAHTFEAGKVKIFFAFECEWTGHSNYPYPIGTSDYRSAYTANLLAFLNQNKCLTDEIVLDAISVHEGSPDLVVLNLRSPVVIYEKRFSAIGEDGVSIALSHYRRTMQTYKKLLLETVGRNYIENDLQVMLCTADENGVYASGFSPDRSLLKCPVGMVIFIEFNWTPVLYWVD